MVLSTAVKIQYLKWGTEGKATESSWLLVISGKTLQKGLKCFTIAHHTISWYVIHRCSLPTPVQEPQP